MAKKADQAEARADQAKALLENQMFQKALKAVKDNIIQQWLDVPARDVDGREWLFKVYKAQERFESVFLGYIDSGKIASEPKPGLISKVFN